MSSATFKITQSPDSVNLILYPNGAIRSGCTVIGAAYNYLAVDDEINLPDEDSTYVYRDGVSQVTDLYSLEDPSITSGTINYLTVYGRVKSYLYPQSASGRYRLITSLSNVSVKTGDIDLSTSYNTYSHQFSSTPSGSIWNWYDVSHCSIGFDVTSPTTAYTGNLTLRPQGVGTNTDIRSVRSGTHWDAVNDIVPDEEYNFVYESRNAYYIDTYDTQDHSTESGTINSVTIYYRTFTTELPDSTGCYSKSVILLAGSYSYGAEIRATYTFTTYSDTFTRDPSGNVWTWANIDAMEIGIDLHGATVYYMGCTQVYAVVNYDISVNPQIRTTQEYSIVNYIPSSSTCYLLKPSEYSLGIGNSVKKLNFWSGNRSVYTEDLDSYSLSMSGSEYNRREGEATYRLNCVKEMKDSGEPVTFSGFDDSNLNDTWLIKDFSFSKDSNNPNLWSWTMSLEKESDTS